jgi:hypothetical protein
MGLNLALEASNNSQIVFSLREWEKKLKGKKGKRALLGQDQQGTAQSYRVEAEGALASCSGCGALPDDLPSVGWQRPSAVSYWLQREGLAAGQSAHGFVDCRLRLQYRYLAASICLQ